MGPSILIPPGSLTLQLNRNPAEIRGVQACISHSSTRLHSQLHIRNNMLFHDSLPQATTRTLRAVGMQAIGKDRRRPCPFHRRKGLLLEPEIYSCMYTRLIPQGGAQKAFIDAAGHHVVGLKAVRCASDRKLISLLALTSKCPSFPLS